ncbi:MAG TPA: VOC family protein, partial [Enhygromyxa sp.]|nr:VOC family protein [Enhygromyxa sp.]
MSTFVHMELNTSDPEAAKQFYEAVFGWQYQDVEMPDGVYTMASAPNGGIGGITRNPMSGAPSAWLGYVGVDSVDRAVGKIEKAGGTVVVPATSIPNMGRFAVFTDPQGAAFAVWEAAAPGSEAQATEAPSKKKTSKKAGKKSGAAKKQSAAAAEPTEEREEQAVSK